MCVGLFSKKMEFEEKELSEKKLIESVLKHRFYLFRNHFKSFARYCQPHFPRSFSKLNSRVEIQLNTLKPFAQRQMIAYIVMYTAEICSCRNRNSQSSD